jgi:hypothetical protein
MSTTAFTKNDISGHDLSGQYKFESPSPDCPDVFPHHGIGLSYSQLGPT